jgi:VWFA-related protein
MTRMYFLPGFFLLFTLPSLATAQSAEPQPTATIHARSDLVLVDVTVLDSQQNPVHHLTADDFKIFEDGRIQTVKNFEEHNADTEPPPSAPMPKLDPGTYTNRTPVPPSGPLNVVLIDYLNTEIGDYLYLSQQVVKFLAHMRPGTQVAIFGIGDRLHLLQGFTSDAARLRAAIAGEEQAALVPSPPADNSAANDGKPPAASTEEVLQKAAHKVSTWQIESPALKQLASEALSVPPSQRKAITLRAVIELAHNLAALPGRKNLIWFSESFLPSGIVSSMLSMNPALAARSEEAGNLLGSNRVAVYPIDDAGLRTDQSLDASVDDTTDPIQVYKDSIKAGASHKPGNVYRVLKKNPNDDVIGGGDGFLAALGGLTSNMQSMADRTGGKAFFNSNDLAGAAEQAVEAGSSYYTLTYVPSKMPEGILPERTIKVEVARKDVSLFYRNKYQVDNPHAQHRASLPPLPAAPPNTPPAAAPALYTAMKAAMMRGAPEPAQIAFQVTAHPTSAETEPSLAPGNQMSSKAKGPYRRYLVRYSASPNNIDCPAAADGVHRCALQFVAYIYDSYGTLVGDLINGVKFAIPAARYNDVMSHGISFNQQISIPASGEYSLRVGILDLNSGRIGAVEFPLAEVAKLTPVSATRP